MKFLPVFAAALLVLFLSGCGGDSNEAARTAADDFMQSVLEGNNGAAYQKASMNFRTRTRFDSFNFEAAKLRVKPDAKLSWSEPEEKDGQPVFQGTVPRESGDPARVTLRMTQEIEEWKVEKFAVE